MKWLLRFQQLLTITKSSSWIINEQTVYRNLKNKENNVLLKEVAKVAKSSILTAFIHFAHWFLPYKTAWVSN